MMKVSIIGAGYVGLVTGACLADLGTRIAFFDIDEKKLKAIKGGNLPLFEPGLKELLQKNSERIEYCERLPDAVFNSDMTMICVGTPSYRNGSINLEFVISACDQVGSLIKTFDSFPSIIIKSTVIPGTTTDVLRPVIERSSGKKVNEGFGLGVNPEFLREGNAIQDFLAPDRIIIGTDNEIVRENLLALYRPIQSPLIATDMTTAEMIKYVSNAFLATKISFANEIGNMCKRMNLDSYTVFDAVGLDKRINPSFFRSGIGFGGSCFPKDIRALIAMAKELGVPPLILESVVEVNERQPRYLLDLVEKYVPIQGSKIGILGLAFKPDTEDIRDSKAIPVIREILKKGGDIIAFDPMAMPNFRNLFPDLSYAETYEGVLDSDIIVILTEWPVFESIDFSGKIVIDGRRIKNARKTAAVYEGVCW